MTHSSMFRFITSLLVMIAVQTTQASKNTLTIKHLGDRQSLVHFNENRRYLLLPIEEKANEAQLYVISNNNVVQTLNIRLAVDKVDYFVPLDLSLYKTDYVGLNFQFVSDSAICWSTMRLSDQFDWQNKEIHRPIYHFTPLYGWMNDPNGMVYKDGLYHLFYQYNPYGSLWGNLHWGHAVSQDLTNWSHRPVALAPDGLGDIFSGCAVVDHQNTAGFGAGAIVCIYTSAGRHQAQSIAYSTDNGASFHKYERNPVLTSTARDFRDPKVFWHEQTNRWIMVVSAGQEMQIFSSSTLKEWTLESVFGENQGAHRGVWECPDLIQLPIKGTQSTKWVLICNLNPGGPFGGSATQYFVGEFDGKQFINDSEPTVTRWMDWGKDHYALVTWSNAPNNRKIGLAWMSNWEYANNLPTQQFRSSNTAPRELFLQMINGEPMLSSAPVQELENIRGDSSIKRRLKIYKPYTIKKLLPCNTGAYEIELIIENINAKDICIELSNTKAESITLSYNIESQRFSMDRSKSGKVDFSPTFASITTAPIQPDKQYKLRLLIDRSSIEVFDGDGKFSMTNLVFPQEPYNTIRFSAQEGSYWVDILKVYSLGKQQ